MADDLEVGMRSIEGEGPSPDFVANLRERIVAETTTSAVASDDDVVIAIDLRPKEEEHVMTKTRLMLVGLSAAAIALIVGFVALSGDSDELETITPPDESTTTTTSTVDESTIFAADATPLPAQFSAMQPGSHRVDNFALPFSFTIEQSLFLQENRSSQVSLSHPASKDQGDKDLVFMPLAVDYDGWLDILAGGLADLDREETTLGSLDVTRVDVDESSCGEDTTFCGEFGMTEAGLSRVFTAGSTYQVWVVEQNGQPPLAVIAGIWDESDSVWFDVVGKMVSTLEFGDAAAD